MSKIEWTHPPGYIGVTWNPVTGCTPCSPGCANCYAARMAKRLRGRYGYPADDPFKVTVHRDKFDVPRRWRKPRFVFLCSMSDLFHKDVHHGVLERIFDTIVGAAQHRFVILTKRSGDMLDWVPDDEEGLLNHVFFGVSVSNQAEVADKVTDLCGMNVARRIVSVEPMLGPVDLRPWLDRLDWVIVGGETGPGARPCCRDWIARMLDQCSDAAVPCFIKQTGTCGATEYELKSRKGSDPSEWPGWMRVREWPNGL